MSFIDSNYTKQKSISHGFMGGLAPWMSENNKGGGTVTTETINGGRAVLSSGTGAVEDRGRIDIDPLTPAGQSGIDAFGFRCTFSLNSGAATAGDAVVQMGLLDADNLNRVYHRPNDKISDKADVIYTTAQNSPSYINTRSRMPTDPITTELLWDTVENTIYHRYQDTYAAKVTGSNVPDPTADYTPKIQVGTNDTSGDKKIYLYDVELAYYSRDRQ